MELQIINNATCTFCGCVCDDIQLHHDEVRIHKANKACVLGTAWFLNHTAEKKYPDALIGYRVPPSEVILDFDPRHGGLLTWQVLCATFDGLEPTRQHHSGRVGSVV